MVTGDIGRRRFLQKHTTSLNLNVNAHTLEKVMQIIFTNNIFTVCFPWWIIEGVKLYAFLRGEGVSKLKSPRK